MFLASGCESPVAKGDASPRATSIQKLALGTTNGGAAYVAECRAAGVPVPEVLLSAEEGWVNHGLIDNPFLSNNTNTESELWSWASSAPEGICLALPRWSVKGTTGFLGLICLGVQSSRACFFDNPAGTYIGRGSTPEIGDLIGGADIDANANGVCTDCHAGANPFVVHPYKEAFVDLLDMHHDLMFPSSGWYEPIMPSAWPQNPGPETRLDAVSSPGSCTSCHQLPIVSRELPGFCNKVLEIAVSRADETMPPPTHDRSEFQAHIDALREFCKEAPPTAGGQFVEVDHVDHKSVLSPPIIIEPVYACAYDIGVRGTVPGGTVRLLRNGIVVDSAEDEWGYGVKFVVADPPVDGDVYTATQSIDGVTSDESEPAVAYEYPFDELPPIAIDPSTVYECADSVSVRATVNGVRIEAWKNDTYSVVGGSRSWMSPGPTPWELGDKFTAQASLCAKVSPISDPVFATEAPEVLRAPTLRPQRPYEGQDRTEIWGMDYGTFASLSLATPTPQHLTDTGGTPIGRTGTLLWHKMNRGETLKVETSLFCEGSSPGQSFTSDGALPCSDLPAPRIAAPAAGQDYVTITEALPGARIRIFDSANIEIADGGALPFVWCRHEFSCRERWSQPFNSWARAMGRRGSRLASGLTRAGTNVLHSRESDVKRRLARPVALAWNRLWAGRGRERAEPPRGGPGRGDVR